MTQKNNVQTLESAEATVVVAGTKFRVEMLRRAWGSARYGQVNVWKGDKLIQRRVTRGSNMSAASRIFKTFIGRLMSVGLFEIENVAPKADGPTPDEFVASVFGRE